MATVIIGLGNPGKEYSLSRHNAGFLVLDYIASYYRVTFRKPLFKKYLIASNKDKAEEELALIKPLTFMNRSGKVLRTVLKQKKMEIDNVIVVCDTLDLPPGVCRFKRKGSSAGNKGLKSIIDYAGTEDFKRIFVGIGYPLDKDVIGHVLSDPQGKEREKFYNGIKKAGESVIALSNQSLEQVMGDLNRRDSK